MVVFGRWRDKPEMGLANVDSVIVDEVDVTFETTRTIHFGHQSPSSTPVPSTSALPTTPISYPFNLLSGTTIPIFLASYLETLIHLSSDSPRRGCTACAKRYRPSTPFGLDVCGYRATDTQSVGRGFRAKVVELGSHLNERETKNVALTSDSETRKRGSTISIGPRAHSQNLQPPIRLSHPRLVW